MELSVRNIYGNPRRNLKHVKSKTQIEQETKCLKIERPQVSFRLNQPEKNIKKNLPQVTL